MTPQGISGFALSLINKGLLDKTAVLAAQTQALQQNTSFIAYLAKQQILSSKTIAESLADFMHLPIFKFTSEQNFLFNLIDEKLMRRYLFLPIVKKAQHVQIAIVDPSHDILENIKFQTGFIIQPQIAEYDKLLSALENSATQKHYNKVQNLEAVIEDDTFIIHFVQQTLTDAIQRNASDIHFEPYENVFRIRFRIDGILYEISKPVPELANRIISRLKVMAKCDISERRIPHDGRFTLTTETATHDCRVSTCPTLFGEKVVVRILDTTPVFQDIDELGFAAEQKQLFLRTLQRPQGLILVTGPTGSGKTNTLYAALNLLNDTDKNICSAEDPVEIQLHGINQVHINPKAGLTFSTALRAFLRQDPDIIMVGEIRDTETAEIAIKAAQTGHLVFSTLHTNSAIETITRLINMGIAPYNLDGALTLIIAQRLARRLCEHCKQPYHYSAEELKAFGFAEQTTATTLFKASHCEHCTQGYQGRIGIFEMLPITRNVTQLLQQTEYKTLKQAAWQKIKEGVTDINEINRVIASHE